jgi:hypothetical protein
MNVEPGTRLGPYQILSPLGAGGMGEVWRARDTRLDRVVAIKLAGAQFTERFDREARAIAQFNHPHICQLYDVGPDYLVMELVDGSPLRGPLPPAKAVEYGVQILDALDAAHRGGFTHRDLKPANILITKGGVKLLDFGLAKAAPDRLQARLEGNDETVAKALTQEGQIVGTLHYMAPEQLQGLPSDARADLFSFGCVLYEMLSGKRAFDGQSAASVIGAVLEREPAPLDIAPPLDRVVRRALAKDPDERFQTARDLKVALLWALEQMDTQPVAKTTKRMWLPWAAAALAVVAAAIFAVLWLHRPQAVTGVATFVLNPPPGVTFNYLITATAISPDGRQLVFRAAAGNGVISLWVRPLDSLSVRPLPGTEGGDFPFWSPDGKAVGYFAGGKLARVDLAGGLPLVLSDAVDGVAGTGGAWNDHGSILLADKRGLSLIPAAGGVRVPLIQAAPGEEGYGYPQFFPDGKHFLYFVASTDPKIEGVYGGSLARPEPRVPLLRTHAKAIYAPPWSGHAGYLLYLLDRTLTVQAFNSRTMRLEGDPVPYAQDVAVHPGFRGAAFWLSETGLLAYRSGFALEKVKLAWVNREGKRLSDAAAEDSYTALSLSRDGRRIVIGRRDPASSTDLWVIDLVRGVQSRFTFAPAVDSCGTWSPDDRQIAYTSAQSGTFQLYRKDAGAAGGEEQLTDTPEFKCVTDWSTDGRFLLYTSQSGTTNDVRALELGGTRRVLPVAESSFNEIAGQFSPDGKWIAYISDESGRFEVYVKAFPLSAGEPGGKWQVSNAGGLAPAGVPTAVSFST